MKIVVEDEDPRLEDEEFSQGIYQWISGWVSKILLVILLGYGGIFITYKLLPKPEVPPKQGWAGLDPTRGPHEVKHWDYDNRRVEYYEPEGPSTKPPVINKAKSGVEIPITKGKSIILTGVSSEEVLESLDIDYEDVRDYLGVELR